MQWFVVECLLSEKGTALWRAGMSTYRRQCTHSLPSLLSPQDTVLHLSAKSKGVAVSILKRSAETVTAIFIAGPKSHDIAVSICSEKS